MSATKQSMGIKDDKAAVSPPASSVKAAPTAGGVTAPGVFPFPNEQHIRTAVQALAYLLAFNEVTKQQSVFDAEREAALACLREHARLIAAAPELLEALTGGPEMPEVISPLSWLRSAIDELDRRGPADDDEDPAAYREMVQELRSFNAAARAALAKVQP